MHVKNNREYDCEFVTLEETLIHHRMLSSIFLLTPIAIQEKQPTARHLKYSNDLSF